MIKKLILLLFAASTFSANAQNYIVVYPADCVNCVAGLYQINKHLADEKFELVYAENFKSDRAEIAENLEIEKLKNMQLVFSNKIIDKYNLQFASFVIVEDGDSLIYKSKIKDVNIAQLKNVIRKKHLKNNVRRIPLDKNKIPSNHKTTPFNDKIIGIENFFGKFTLFNMETNEYRDLKLTNDLKKSLHRELLKESFDSKYPTIQEMIEEMPIYKPKLIGVKFAEAGEIYLEINIMNYFIKTDGSNDTAFYQDNLVASYDFDEHKIKSYSSFKNKSFRPMYYIDFLPIDGRLAVQVENLDYPDNSILYWLKGENGIMVKDGETNVKKTRAFIENNIVHIGEELKTHKNYVLGQYDNVIYDIKNNKKIIIPFADSIRTDMPSLELIIRKSLRSKRYYNDNRAIALDDDGNLILLFYYNYKSFLMNVNENKVVEIPKSIKRLWSSEKYGPIGFYKDASTLIALDWDKKEIVLYEHHLFD